MCWSGEPVTEDEADWNKIIPFIAGYPLSIDASTIIGHNSTGDQGQCFDESAHFQWRKIPWSSPFRVKKRRGNKTESQNLVWCLNLAYPALEACAPAFGTGIESGQYLEASTVTRGQTFIYIIDESDVVDLSREDTVEDADL